MGPRQPSSGDGTIKRSTSTPSGLELAKDEAYHLLQNPRRRAVLRYILEHREDSYRMRDITEAIAAWEQDTTIQGITYRERQRVYTSLYQSHLPQLDEAGVIHYNQDRGIVEPRPAIYLLEPLLDDGLEADTDLTIESRPYGLPRVADVLAHLSR